MIHGDHHVELRKAAGPHEHRVRRKWPLCIDAQALRLANRGANDADLLIAQQPILSGVRIDPCHRNPWRLEARTAQESIGQPDGFDDSRHRQPLDGLA